MKNNKIIILSIILSVVFSAVLFFYGFNNFNKVHQVFSSTNLKPLYGYAWSSNIGWISFNGTNYGVYVDASTGNLSGYAWSSNIGWIRFNPPSSASDPYPTSPNYPAKIDFANKTVTGWMRACSVFEDNTKCEGSLKDNWQLGGWDGWIKLTDAKIGNGGIIGYAWGDLNVGWIRFEGVKFLYCNFYADPTKITLPNYSTLYWQCQFADTCSIDNGVGSVNSSGGQVRVRPTKSTTYTMTCSGLGGQTSKSASVEVSLPKIRYREVAP